MNTIWIIVHLKYWKPVFRNHLGQGANRGDAVTEPGCGVFICEIHWKSWIFSRMQYEMRNMPTHWFTEFDRIPISIPTLALMSQFQHIDRHEFASMILSMILWDPCLIETFRQGLSVSGRTHSTHLPDGPGTWMIRVPSGTHLCSLNTLTHREHLGTGISRETRWNFRWNHVKIPFTSWPLY